MTKFHINSKGDAARCKATERACPLGGQHYDSMEDAAMATFTFDLDQRGIAGAGQPTVTDLQGDIETLVADLEAMDDPDDRAAHVQRVGKMLYDSGDIDSMVTARRALFSYSDRLTDDFDGEVGTPAFRAAWVDAQMQAKTQAVVDKFSELNQDFLAEYGATIRPFRNHKGDREMIVVWHNAAGGTEQRTYAPDDDIYAERGESRKNVEGRVGSEQLSEWDLETARLARRDEAANVPLEWSVELLSRDESTIAASEASRYWAQRGQLIELTRLMLQEADGDDEIRNSAYYEQLQAVARLQAAPSKNPGGRSRGVTPIDPEFVQALRAMYIAKFGVDPFESGVSVGQLLTMMKAGLLR